MIIELLVIVLIVFFAFESGFMNSLRNGIARILNTKPEYIRERPVFCLICNSFWCQIIYLIITHQLSLLSILAAIVLSNFTDVISEIYFTVKHNIMKLLSKMQ